jgi:hypothetical protein
LILQTNALIDPAIDASGNTTLLLPGDQQPPETAIAILIKIQG